MNEEMPDFIPDADIGKYQVKPQNTPPPQGQPAPDFIADDDPIINQMKLVDQPQPKFGTTKSRAMTPLQAQHAANIKAGEVAYKPGWLESYQLGGIPYIQSQMMGAPAFTGAMEQIVGAPKRFAETIMGAPQFIQDVLGGKGAQVGTKMVEGMTEPLMSPRTTGEAIAGGAADAALMGAIGGTAVAATRGQQALGRIISTGGGRAARLNRQGTNQILRALDADERTMSALDATQGHFQDYIAKTGRSVTESKSGAAVFGDAAKGFYSTEYSPLVEEIKKYKVKHLGQDVDPNWLLERREWLNDRLGELGYYDKDPIARSFAKTSPETHKVLQEAEAVRGSLNTAVDTIAPTNVGAANILRTYADMKQVADVARIMSKRTELAKRLKAGEAEPASQYIKDAIVGLATMGLKGPALQKISNAMWRGLTTKAPVDPDKLFARGARNWAKGSEAAAKPRPISRTSQAAPQVTTPTPAPVTIPSMSPATFAPGAAKQTMVGKPKPSTQPAPQPTPQKAPGIAPQAAPQQTTVVPQAQVAPPQPQVTAQFLANQSPARQSLRAQQQASQGTIPVAPAATPPISPVPAVTPIGGGQYNLNIGGGQQTLAPKAGETLEAAIRRTQQNYANAPAVNQRIRQTGLPPGVRSTGRSFGKDIYEVDTAQGTYKLEVGAGENFVQMLQDLWRRFGRLD